MASPASVSVLRFAFTIRLTASERNFWRASLLVVCWVLAFEAAFWVRARVDPTSAGTTGAVQLLPVSSEVAMRYVALPHFAIGFLFMVTAQKNRNRSRRLLISGLLLLSALLCWAYGRLQEYLPDNDWSSADHYFARTGTNIIMLFPIILYFLVHELRDQAFFYTLLGNGVVVPDKARFQRYVRRLIGFTLGGLLVATWTFALFGHAPVLPVLLPDMGLTVKVCLAGIPIAVLLGAAYLIPWLYVRGTSWSVADVFVNHAPLLRVFAGVVFWLFVGLSTRTGAFLVNTLHVAGWYVFTCYMLARRGPQAPAQGWWGWLRTTLPGFRVLHIGLVVALLAVGALWVSFFGQEGWLWWVISPRSFYYWTLVHITVSFVPR